jgi:anti-sigma factor ChrR (cupin superfamily)
MTMSDETLMAYADGELDAATRVRVEAAMQEDPEIGKRVARHRALRETMRGAFSGVLGEPVPDRLIQAARGQTAATRAQTAAPQSAVVDLSLAREAARRKKSAAPRRWQPAAMAASLLLGLGLGFLAWHGPGGALIQPGSGGGLVARAALADALTRQLSDDRSPEHVAVTGLSFRDKSGDYCRTFSLAGPAASSGLACHEGADWRIKALAQSAQVAANSGNFRTAASEDSPAIRAAVEGSIDGEALDHAGEISAREAGWAAASKR